MGGAAAFQGLPAPDLILITDIHGDHMDAKAIDQIKKEGTVIVAPADLDLQTMVDDYFLGLPRYKALYQRYHKDRNLFSFFRDAVALPEVRTGVKKYMLNGEAMKVGVMMLAEGLTQPVPQPVMQTSAFARISGRRGDNVSLVDAGRVTWPSFSSRARVSFVRMRS